MDHAKLCHGIKTGVPHVRPIMEFNYNIFYLIHVISTELCIRFLQGQELLQIPNEWIGYPHPSMLKYYLFKLTTPGKNKSNYNYSTR